jgi:hypothetical protein
MVESMEFTADDLVEEARRRGFADVTHRLVVDWTQRGLIDQPWKSGRGPGEGRGTRKGTWNQFQRDLFLREVDQHNAEARKIATLCNIPVFVWEWWGDEWVPLRQVRRAMGTYCDTYRTSSARAGRYSARELAGLLGKHGGSRELRRARQEFIELLAECAVVGRVSDYHHAELVHRGRLVFAEDLPPDMIEGYLQLVEAKLVAIAKVPGLTDEEWYWARHVYRMTRTGYAEDYPKLAENPAVSSRFEPPNLQETGNQACVDLLAMIGLVEQAKAVTDPALRVFFDPSRSPLMATFQLPPQEVPEPV